MAEQCNKPRSQKDWKENPKVYFLLTLLPWTNMLTFLRLHFLIYKMGILIPTYRFWRANEHNIWHMGKHSINTMLSSLSFLPLHLGSIWYAIYINAVCRHMSFPDPLGMWIIPSSLSSSTAYLTPHDTVHSELFVCLFCC